jgi:WD40 repeat protein
MPHGHDVSSVRFSPDDSKIAAFSEQNNAVAIVDVPTGNIDTLLSGFKWGEYSQDGNYIYAPKGKLIYQINTQDYSYSSPFDTAVGGLASISISDNGLAVCRTGNGFQVWDMNTGEIIFSKTFIEPDNEGNTGDYLASVKITKDGNYLIICLTSAYKDFKGDSHCLKLYSEILNLSIFEKENEVKNTMAVFPSNTNKYIAFDYQDCEVSHKMTSFVYDIQLDSIILSIQGISSKPDIAFSPDDRYMAVAFRYLGKIIIYDLETKEEKYFFNLGTYHTVDWSPNGYYIAGSVGEVLGLHFTDSVYTLVDNFQIDPVITYPNPTQDIFNLEFDLIQNGNTRIDIINTIGSVIKIVENSFLTAGNYLYQIDISELPVGFYLILLETKSQTISFPLLKQ